MARITKSDFETMLADARGKGRNKRPSAAPMFSQRHYNVLAAYVAKRNCSRSMIELATLFMIDNPRFKPTLWARACRGE